MAECLRIQGKINSSSSLKILDLGCGEGLVGAALQANGFTNVTGLDLSASMLTGAEKRGCYVDLQKADLLKPLPFVDDSIDVIVSVGVTSYLSKIYSKKLIFSNSYSSGVEITKLSNHSLLHKRIKHNVACKLIHNYHTINIAC